MKSIQVKNAGGPEVLNLVHLPKPKIKTGWTLVKVKGFGINRSEFLQDEAIRQVLSFLGF